MAERRSDGLWLLRFTFISTQGVDGGG